MERHARLAMWSAGFLAGVAVLLGLGPAGSLLPLAQAQVACGAVLGPGGSTTLQANVGPCDGTAPALTLNGHNLRMNNFAVFCQDLNDDHVLPTGIVMAGRAAEVRQGTVTGCKNGVTVSGMGGHKVGDMTVTDNKRDGILVDSDNNLLRNITANGNGINGIHINILGQNNRVYDSTALGNQGTDLVDDNPNCDKNQWVNSSPSSSRSKGCIH